jgi:hypothetical protein
MYVDVARYQAGKSADCDCNSQSAQVRSLDAQTGIFFDDITLDVFFVVFIVLIVNSGTIVTRSIYSVYFNDDADEPSSST